LPHKIARGQRNEVKNLKWFKHQSDSSIDAKLQEVFLDYGFEGYGLYWYCLELISTKVDKNNLTFELEHDARIIARQGGTSVQKVEEMMKRFIELRLFENSQGRITCLKLSNLADEYTTKLTRKLKTPDSVRTKSALTEEKERKEKKEKIEEIRKNNGLKSVNDFIK
jgi:hypothetical protein